MRSKPKSILCNDIQPFSLNDLSEGKEFGEYLLDLAKRKILRTDLNEYWKLYEKLECWKNEVWCQLLKSQISALT